MTTPHKHHDVIVAWAQGKPIQWRRRDTDNWENWTHIQAPAFAPYYEYRIKPEPIQVKYRVYLWQAAMAEQYDVSLVRTEGQASFVEKGSAFRGWIGDWQTQKVTV